MSIDPAGLQGMGIGLGIGNGIGGVGGVAGSRGGGSQSSGVDSSPPDMQKDRGMCTLYHIVD
jgi:hypothetical protein